MSAAILAGSACADSSTAEDAGNECSLPDGWDGSAFANVTEERDAEASELRHKAMSVGTVVRSDQFQVSVTRATRDDVPPPTGTVTLEEWQEAADVFVIVEEREEGTTGVLGEDWCFSIWQSQDDFDSTVETVRAVTD